MADVGTAIRDTLISPNESDRNMEPANVVDGLYAIARAVIAHAEAIRELAAALERANGGEHG